MTRHVFDQNRIRADAARAGRYLKIDRAQWRPVPIERLMKRARTAAADGGLRLRHYLRIERSGQP